MAGRVWKFGDGVDTDVLAPGAYMKGPVSDLATHCLEAVRSEFAKEVKEGDYIVAGKNFGIGSSREQAAQVLVILGIKAIIAPSFGGIFYRNAYNLGLPALVCADAASIEDGQNITVETAQGLIRNHTTNLDLKCDAVPDHLNRIVEAGGLIPYLEQTLGGHK